MIDVFLPGSVTAGLLLLALSGWWAITHPKSGRARRVWSLMLLWQVALALPVGVRACEMPLTVGQAWPDLSALQAEGGIGAVFVLDSAGIALKAGSQREDLVSPQSALRGMAALRLLDQVSVPLVVVTAGGTGGREPEGTPLATFMRARVSSKTEVLLDSLSPSTRAHAVNMAALARARGITRVAVVTTATHLPRAVRAFQREGLAVVGVPAPVRTERTLPWPEWVLPHSDWLDASRAASHEYVGLVYYWWQGWL